MAFLRPSREARLNVSISWNLKKTIYHLGLKTELEFDFSLQLFHVFMCMKYFIEK